MQKGRHGHLPLFPSGDDMPSPGPKAEGHPGHEQRARGCQRAAAVRNPGLFCPPPRRRALGRPAAAGPAVSPDPLPVPASCRAAYQRYAADLGRSALAATTRAYHARAVRRFLRWLPGNAEAGNVLSHPGAWDAAVTRFLGELADVNGPLSADLQAHRSALADCAVRLGLTQPYVSVPDRFGCLHDAYTAATATTAQATATRDFNRAAVRAFLRWLETTGYTGDLRRDWATAATRYLGHLSGKGNAASTVLRQRAALNDCASHLGLSRVTLPPQPGRHPVPAGASR
jgi:hypothetical protein